MSRTLNDDFEDEPRGSLDLETDGGQVGGGVPSSYNDGAIDLDDALRSDAGSGHAELELDIPGGFEALAAPAPPAAPAAPPPPELPLELAGPTGPVPPRSSPTLAADAPGGAPAGPAAPPPPSSSQAIPPAPPSESGPNAAASANESGQHPAQEAAPPAKPTAASVIGNYPPPPQQIIHAPMYAIRVVLRQLELRTDLESLRRRRSPDVPLYEAALSAYEPKTFRLGMAINCAALTVATFVFFLPVIIRFMRD